MGRLSYFQFPLWWFSVPAILKGWFDKIFMFGGIYGGEYDRYDKARLTDKIAMISTTTGSPEGSYAANGFQEIFMSKYYSILTMV